MSNFWIWNYNFIVHFLKIWQKKLLVCLLNDSSFISLLWFKTSIVREDHATTEIITKLLSKNVKGNLGAKTAFFKATAPHISTSPPRPICTFIVPVRHLVTPHSLVLFQAAIYACTTNCLFMKFDVRSEDADSKKSNTGAPLERSVSCN